MSIRNLGALSCFPYSPFCSFKAPVDDCTPLSHHQALSSSTNFTAASPRPPVRPPLPPSALPLPSVCSCITSLSSQADHLTTPAFSTLRHSPFFHQLHTFPTSAPSSPSSCPSRKRKLSRHRRTSSVCLFDHLAVLTVRFPCSPEQSGGSATPSIANLRRLGRTTPMKKILVANRGVRTLSSLFPSPRVNTDSGWSALARGSRSGEMIDG